MFQDIQDEVVIYYLAGSAFTILLVATIIFYVFQHQKKVNLFRFRLQQEEIEKQHAVYAALQEGEEKERKRIAEELHDGISAKLSGLNMNLDYVLSRPQHNPIPLIQKTFDGISETVNELREISHNLHPAFFAEKDFKSLVLGFIAQLNSKSECRYELYWEADLSDADKTIKLHCYRIVIELLHNIHRHARAKTASLQLVRDGNDLEIIAEDDGIGFQAHDIATGQGLSNIQNRVRFNKGAINIDSSENGTTIIIKLKLINTQG